MRILVIKLGALGDFAQAFGPFAAIRANHPDARITLLTTKPYAPLARMAPWFDDVWEDGRPSWTDLGAVLGLARRLRGARFERVYDLQTSGRSSSQRATASAFALWRSIRSGRVSRPWRSCQALNGESAAPMSRSPWTRSLMMNARLPKASVYETP